AIAPQTSAYCGTGACRVETRGFLMPLKSIRKAGMILAAAVPLSLLGGCGDGGIGGFDGVALNGKIFDAVGLNSSAGPKGEPKMAARQPLVVPPGLDSLPPPGSAKAEQPTLAEIQDPDRKAQVS